MAQLKVLGNIQNTGKIWLWLSNFNIKENVTTLFYLVRKLFCLIANRQILCSILCMCGCIYSNHSPALMMYIPLLKALFTYLYVRLLTLNKLSKSILWEIVAIQVHDNSCAKTFRKPPLNTRNIILSCYIRVSLLLGICNPFDKEVKFDKAL